MYGFFCSSLFFISGGMSEGSFLPFVFLLQISFSV